MLRTLRAMKGSDMIGHRPFPRPRQPRPFRVTTDTFVSDDDQVVTNVCVHYCIEDHADEADPREILDLIEPAIRSLFDEGDIRL